jgi:DNA-directed RNA polymerase specialized sigma24 family protein
MRAKGSVTLWLDQVQAGDPAAARHLWQRYFGRLVRLARMKLRGAARRASDEEDVALSAFDSFCRGVAQGRFPWLNDRDNLWNLLVVLTARKALNLKRDEGRQKRGGARPDPDSASGADDVDVEQLISREPGPEFAAQMAEECRRLLDLLADDMLQTIAVCKMEGYTNEELARRFNCAPRTIERKLALIRGLWEKENPC